MRARVAGVLLAGVVVAAVGGCGDRADGAAIGASVTPSGGAPATSVVDSVVDSVAGAVTDADALLRSLDAELAADAADE